MRRLAAFVTPLMLTLCMIIAACNGTETSFSDGEAKKVINAEIKSWGLELIPLGEVTLVNTDSLGEGEISEAEFKDVEAWSNAGLVTITGRGVLGNSRPFSWEDWFARNQGQLKRLTITPTSKGLALQSSTELPAKADGRFSHADQRFGEFLHGRLFSCRIESIVENRELQRASGLYRLIKAVMTTEWTDVGLEVQTAAGLPLWERRKVAVLLLHDPFNKRWNSVTWDMANLEDTYFATANVDKHLQRHPE